MGRTVKTASMLITDEAGRWRDFRAALRSRDRDAFDRLSAYSKRHFSAVSNSGIIDPFEAVILGILLEYEKRIKGLEDERDLIRLRSRGGQGSPMDKDRE